VLGIQVGTKIIVRWDDQATIIPQILRDKMRFQNIVLLLAMVIVAPLALRGQASESSINKQLQALRVLPGPTGGPNASKAVAIPEAQRPAAIMQAAKDIRSLPAGSGKVKLADALFHVATVGEAGRDAIQATADTLVQTLTETPQPEKDGIPAPLYMDLAKLVRYGGMTTSLNDSELAKAAAVLAANDADVAKADFTLKDMNSKKVTLSALKGKIVLINFWNTGCPNCVEEMQDLDLIYTHYQQQGLVILSITGDNPFFVGKYLAGKNYHPTVLFDDGNKVGKAFHVDQLHPEGLPRTFVFDREGKLVGESIDMCTQRQFFIMLGKAGLKPQGSQ